MSDWTMTGQLVSKSSDDKRLVFGFASTILDNEGNPLVDKQGDVIQEWEIEKAAYRYMLNSRDGGIEHVVTGVGKCVESMVFTQDKLDALSKAGVTVDGVKPGSWWIGFYVQDDDVWESVKKGELSQFSIHGTGKRRKIA